MYQRLHKRKEKLDSTKSPQLCQIAGSFHIITGRKVLAVRKERRMEQTDKNIQRRIAGIKADVSSEPEGADKPDRAEKAEKEKETGRREKLRYRMEEDDNSIYEYDLVCLNGKW